MGGLQSAFGETEFPEPCNYFHNAGTFSCRAVIQGLSVLGKTTLQIKVPIYYLIIP